MSHKIKTITFNGKTIASKDNTLIKRVIFNGVVIWPYSPPVTSDLVIATYDDGTCSLYDETKAGHLAEKSSSKTNSSLWTIRRVLYNGEELWARPSEKDYLTIEKEHIILNALNHWSDTNTIYTNLTFTIN